MKFKYQGFIIFVISLLAAKYLLNRIEMANVIFEDFYKTEKSLSLSLGYDNQLRAYKGMGLAAADNGLSDELFQLGKVIRKKSPFSVFERKLLLKKLDSLELSYSIHESNYKLLTKLQENLLLKISPKFRKDPFEVLVDSFVYVETDSIRIGLALITDFIDVPEFELFYDGMPIDKDDLDNIEDMRDRLTVEITDSLTGKVQKFKY